MSYTDKDLCVVHHLDEYIRRTATIRKDKSQLLISYIKPHNQVSKDTIARWVKGVLKDADVNTNNITHRTVPERLQHRMDSQKELNLPRYFKQQDGLMLKRLRRIITNQSRETRWEAILCKHFRLIRNQIKPRT